MTAAVFDDRACALGEGPLWHPLREQLFWFDITAGRLLTRDAEGAREWQIGRMASAAGWVDRDTLLIATETGLARFDIATGGLDEIAPLEADTPATRSNDGRADPQGGFWIGTMGKAAEDRAGAIYRYHAGRVERLFDRITIPNAICFAPGGGLAYFADTADGRIMAQPLDAEGWPTGRAEVFVDLRGTGFNPDGAVTDAEGGVWNAQWGAGRVARYLPDGSFDRAVPVGGRHASCPAFGGAGLATLYVTSARQGIPDPDAAQGLTYVLDPGCAGVPEPCVRL